MMTMTMTIQYLLLISQVHRIWTFPLVYVLIQVDELVFKWSLTWRLRLLAGLINLLPTTNKQTNKLQPNIIQIEFTQITVYAGNGLYCQENVQTEHIPSLKKTKKPNWNDECSQNRNWMKSMLGLNILLKNPSVNLTQEIFYFLVSSWLCFQKITWKHEWKLLQSYQEYLRNRECF
jgi:hypothetical protein